MALILAEGFGAYGFDGSKNWLADSRWVSGGGTTTTILASVGRSGSGGMRLHYGAARYYAKCTFGGEKSTIYTGFAYKPPYVNQDNPILQFQYGANDQTCLYVLNTGAIQAKTTIGGSILGTSAAGIITPSWQYWEVKVVCDSSDGVIEIRIDGTEVLNLTGINTQTYGSDGITALTWNSIYYSATSYCYIDDIIIYDSTGTTFNDFMGDLAVVGHLPEADGTDTDWTSTKPNHYDAVNDVGNGYDTDYIEDSTENHMDCFTITPAGTYPSIVGVEVAAYGLNTGGGTAKITPYVRIGGVVYYGDELTLSAGSTDKRSYIWETNPATGTLWNKTVVEAAEFGYKVTEIT